MLMVLTVLLTAAPALAEGYATSDNPLIDPQPLQGYTRTKDEFFHILLLGIDYGMDGYWGSGHKTVLENCHTDAVMVVSINLDKEKINLVSLPRDTLTYVPGVHGIYKLNAAINCAENMEQGIKNVCAAASQLLGGIKIDRYIAVDMNAMVTLCDAIGGVDFEMDMNYTGHSGRAYRMGMQHLDGQGIMDYVRARTNATAEGKINDIGRTERQRNMMTAIFKKILSNIQLIDQVYGLTQDGKTNIFMNVDRDDFWELVVQLLRWRTIMENGLTIDSYVLTGPYITGMSQWNFTFTDQDNRIAVLKEVYGVDADKIPYVSVAYTKWLEDNSYDRTLNDAFQDARYILVARQIIDYAQSLPFLFSDQQEAVNALIAAHDTALTAFDRAANTLNEQDSRAMRSACSALREQGELVATLIDYPENLQWIGPDYWWLDTMLNEYLIDWR